MNFWNGPRCLTQRKLVVLRNIVQTNLSDRNLFLPYTTARGALFSKQSYIRKEISLITYR